MAAHPRHHRQPERRQRHDEQKPIDKAEAKKESQKHALIRRDRNLRRLLDHTDRREHVTDWSYRRPPGIEDSDRTDIVLEPERVAPVWVQPTQCFWPMARPD